MEPETLVTISLTRSHWQDVLVDMEVAQSIAELECGTELLREILHGEGVEI